MPAGRPSSYKPEYAEQAAKLCALGATNEQLADFFKVGITTVERWASTHEEFRGALKVGKEPADDKVERSLFQRATGYTFDAIKVFQHQGQPVTVPYREHVPPDTTAAIFWLKNRRPDLWRDKQEIDHGVTDELAALIREGHKRAQQDKP